MRIVLSLTRLWNAPSSIVPRVLFCLQSLPAACSAPCVLVRAPLPLCQHGPPLHPPPTPHPLPSAVCSVLGSNQLSGSIPTTFTALAALTMYPKQPHLHPTTDLSSNDLEGPIPDSMGRMANLTVLNLSSNKLNGTIPAALGSMTSLKHLYLQSNSLSSSLPSTLGGLSALVDLAVGNNRQLNGSIPDSLGSISTLERLYTPPAARTHTLPLRMCGHKSTAIPTIAPLHHRLHCTAPSPQPCSCHAVPLPLSYPPHPASVLSGNSLQGTIPSTFSQLTNLEQLSVPSHPTPSCLLHLPANLSLPPPFSSLCSLQPPCFFCCHV
ncbi:unnamed protein product [Closterium sp. Naga37s-1]|nr:unnamed protein product [Closterium sp. Naga37s-1]